MATITGYDDFQRGDAGSLGAPWTDRAQGLDLVSNGAAPQATGTNLATFEDHTWPGDHQSSCRLLSGAGTVGTCGPVCRGQAGLSAYVLVIDLDGDTHAIYSIVAGTPTLEGTFTPGFPTNGDVYSLLAASVFVLATFNGTGAIIVDATVSGGSPGLFGDLVSGTPDVRMDRFRGYELKEVGSRLRYVGPWNNRNRPAPFKPGNAF